MSHVLLIHWSAEETFFGAPQERANGDGTSTVTLRSHEPVPPGEPLFVRIVAAQR